MAKVSLVNLVGEATAGKAGEHPEPNEETEPVTVTKQGEEKPPEEPATTQPAATRRTTRRTKVVKALATVYTPHGVYKALSRHVQNQRAKGELLSYGLAVLLAVEKHADELATLWTAEPHDEQNDSIFGVKIRKAPPKKVPWQLHGATPQQVRKLDDLADQWHAPNRSVLVEQALVRYLDIKPPKEMKDNPGKQTQNQVT